MDFLQQFIKPVTVSRLRHAKTLLALLKRLSARLIAVGVLPFGVWSDHMEASIN